MIRWDKFDVDEVTVHQGTPDWTLTQRYVIIENHRAGRCMVGVLFSDIDPEAIGPVENLETAMRQVTQRDATDQLLFTVGI